MARKKAATYRVGTLVVDQAQLEFKPKVGYLAVPTDWDPHTNEQIPTRLWDQASTPAEAADWRESARRHRLDCEKIVEVLTLFRVVDPGQDPPTPTEDDLNPTFRFCQEQTGKAMR